MGAELDMVRDEAEGLPLTPEKILEGLDPEQRAAVTHGPGALRVFACAGSGKTRALTRRIAWLIATRQARPDQILAITFTTKAAGEMRSRVGRLVGREASKGLTVKTIHSLGYRIVREWGVGVLGLREPPTVMDDQEASSALRSIARQVGIEPPRPTAKEIRKWQDLIGLAKMGGYGPQDWHLFIRSQNVIPTPETEEAGVMYARYNAWCRNGAKVDFDDLIALSDLVLRKSQEAREECRRRWPWVFVDEWQDTSEKQASLIYKIAPPGSNIMVVGDDDQSIYSFRGASPRILLDFDKAYGGCDTIYLKHNYRSDAAIVDMAAALIGHNSQRENKPIIPACGSSVMPRYENYRLDKDEAEAVAMKIVRLHDGGSAWSDIAALYRTHLSSTPLIQALRRHKVPFRVRGNDQFLRAREVRDVLAWISAAANPHDDASLMRAMGSPKRGIGGRTLSTLQDQAMRTGLGLSSAARSAAAGELGIGKKQAAALADILEILEAFDPASWAAANPGGLEEYASALIIASGLPATWNGSEGSDEEEARQREQNVSSLLSIMAAWDIAVQHSSSRPLQERAAGFKDALLLSSRDPQGPASRDAVTLSTIHSAKGLEWDHVFLVALNDIDFPGDRKRQLADWRRRYGEAMAERMDAARIEEERRLFYVGITRARKTLELSSSGKVLRRDSSGMRYAMTDPTRFLPEIGFYAMDGRMRRAS